LLETTTANPTKTLRASAMIFYPTNSSCVLGKAPAYADAYISNSQPEEQYGVFFLKGIPTGEAIPTKQTF
jgi:hypothetical protein